jgi:hypothetical protein
MASSTKHGVTFTPEIEYTADGRAQVKKLGPKMSKAAPKAADTVLIGGPSGTYVDFKKTGWPFEEPVPKEPVRVPAGPYTLKSLSNYHIQCGKIVKKKFEAAPGGLTIPVDL